MIGTVAVARWKRKDDAMHELVARHRQAIQELCRAYGVARLEIFGSAMTDAFDPDRSDVDFLVVYPPDYDYGPWLSRFQNLEAALAVVLDRDVDLVMESALKNPWFARSGQNPNGDLRLNWLRDADIVGAVPPATAKEI